MVERGRTLTPIKLTMGILGLSQKYVAEQIGISRAWLCTICNGYIPSREIKTKIAKILSTPINQLWD